MKQVFILALALGAIGSLLFSCTTDTKQTAETSKATTLFKRTNNEVIAVNISDVDKLNPVLSRTGYANTVHDHIFQFLEYIHPKTSELTPQIAIAAPIIEDVKDNKGESIGSRFTYEIRKEARWPNGSPVLASDYVFSLKTVFVPQVDAGPLRPYLKNISSVELYPDNPRKLTVSTNRKYILSQVAISGAVAILPKYYYDPNGLLDDVAINDLLDVEKAQDLADTNVRLQEFADHFQSAQMVQNPVGSGAYELETWDTNQRIILKKKQNWWGEQLHSSHPFFQAKVDRITYRVIADANVAATELKAEQVDVQAQIAPATFNELKDNELAQRYYNFHRVPTNAVYFLYLNTQDPKLADKRVRKALAHTLDVQKIIQTLYDNSPTPVNGVAHPSKAYYRKDLLPVPLDIEQAKILLAEAGWKDSDNNGIVDKTIAGEQLELELEILISAQRDNHAQLALIFQRDAIKAGIKITPVAKETNIMRQDLVRRAYQITLGGTRSPSVAWDPSERFHSDSDSPNGGNYMQFRNAEADRLMDAIQTTLDQEKRYDLYREFQALLYEEQPLIPLFVPSNNIMIHKRFDAEAYSERPGYFPELFELNL
ncbi:MAG: ABC transporter substrate-binding protein [Bacteroidota bacterium]